MANEWLLVTPEISLLLGVSAVAFVAAFVKGVVGFAYPMIMISGLSFLLDLEVAVAFLVLPLFVVNAVQALQFGVSKALRMSMRQWPIILSLSLTLLVTARFVIMVPHQFLWLVLGVTITAVASLQLIGWKFVIVQRYRRPAELLAGLGAGVFGGFAGVWAPLIVTYFISIAMSKRQNILAQGVIYTWGAIVLMLAHRTTEVLNAETMRVSALLVVPSVAGLLLGFALNSRLDSPTFRLCIQIALVAAGLNLIAQATLN